ncbi:MAG: 5-formyltetrahydrofolate cyclo-ligase [Bacteroidales bacterium]|nr:5-formyltetrahydrofolate cyclo-ligase [Bacteroidales bacterium]
MPGVPDALAAQKRSLRRLLKERRESFWCETTPEERAAYVESVWAQVEASDAFRSARTVLLYASLPDELPTDIVLKRWSQEAPDPIAPVMPGSTGHPSAGKTLVLPLVEGASLRLKRYRPDAVKPGYQGILEPLPSCPDIAPEAIDFAIIPGRAFTPDGWRLGRGKGFYDRLLPTLANALKVGVAYPYQIVEQLPVGPWDAHLDVVYY